MLPVHQSSLTFFLRIYSFIHVSIYDNLHSKSRFAYAPILPCCCVDLFIRASNLRVQDGKDP